MERSPCQFSLKENSMFLLPPFYLILTYKQSCSVTEGWVEAWWEFEKAFLFFSCWSPADLQCEYNYKLFVMSQTEVASVGLIMNNFQAVFEADHLLILKPETNCLVFLLHTNYFLSNNFDFILIWSPPRVEFSLGGQQHV